MPRALTIGAMDQWVTWQRNTNTVRTLASLTAANGVATATTATAHGFASGAELEIAGANEPEYNGRVLVTVLDALRFSYHVVQAAPSPATGTITASTVDAHWTAQQQSPLAAEVRAVSGFERIQAQGVQASTLYRVRLWAVALSPEDRLVWNGIPLQVTAVLQLPGTGFIECDCTTEAD